MNGRAGRIFANITPADIKLVKEIALARGFGRATWHGLRRGRTVDVVAGLDLKHNPAASLTELYASGGWKPGSRAFFQYLPLQEAHKERLAHAVAGESDSE